MSSLTLPGDIPGLLRRCSPVFAKAMLFGRIEKKGQRFAEAGTSLIVEAIGLNKSGEDIIRVCGVAASYLAKPGQLDLDLTEATGRAHALWYLNGTTQPGLDYPIYRCEAFYELALPPRSFSINFHGKTIKKP